MRRVIERLNDPDWVAKQVDDSPVTDQVLQEILEQFRKVIEQERLKNV
jgi:hypothetical protein